MRMADQGMKEVMDTVSVATGVGALAGVLPSLAALFTVTSKTCSHNAGYTEHCYVGTTHGTG
jgi:hypothetical protein